jgi:DNA-binding transcriptional ArsR family regulator
MKRDQDITDPRIGKALAHPLRVAILRVLDERVASPSEIARELDVKVEVLAYHVRKLERLKLIRLVDRQPRRGAVEHYYKAETRPVIKSDAWGRMPAIAKEAMIGAALGELGKEITTAAKTGGFDRSEAHLSRSPIVLDEKGFAQVAAKLDRLLAELEQIGEAAENRLAKADHEGEIRAMVALMMFENTQIATPTAARRARTAKARRTIVR